MKVLGDFKRVASKETIKYDISGFNKGVNSVKSHFINVDSENRVKWVVNRVCDHAGGPLILRGDCAVCPMHNWQLDMETLVYKNSAGTRKQCLDFIVEGKELTVESDITRLVNDFKELLEPDESNESYFRWHNHACVEVSHAGTSLITDPWLIGSAFINGWWLKTPTREDALNALKSSDFVYISHNHPDHLNPQTLSYLNKNTKILVPPFISRSTFKYLETLGFDNIHELEFQKVYELEKGFQIAILKSGDFRDDSGLYIACGDKELLLTVDANYLNGHNLPENIDYLLTSFAGGASGYPFIYDNFSDEEKSNIAKRNLGATLARVRQYLSITKPRFYMPYAGMFETALVRDNYITELNRKNNYTDLKQITEAIGVKYLKPDSTSKIMLMSGEMCEVLSDVVEVPDPKNSLELFKRENPRLTLSELSEYFTESEFSGNQILQIIQTDDNFQPLEEVFTFVQFGEEILVKEQNLDQIIPGKKGFNVMKMYVRYESLSHLIRNKMPWEDLTIGYQCRIIREPNIYEADFWYYFTNIYIKGIHKRSTKDCRSCAVIETKLDNIKLWI